MANRMPDVMTAISERTAVYRIYDADDVLLYVGSSKNPAQRWKQHRQLKSWWPQVARREVAWFDSRPDALFAERQAILAENPLHNSPNDPQGWLPGVKGPPSADMPEVLAVELRDTQQALTESVRRLRLERQRLVMKACAIGCSRYRIAETLGVQVTTVGGIIASAERAAA